MCLWFVPPRRRVPRSTSVLRSSHNFRTSTRVLFSIRFPCSFFGTCIKYIAHRQKVLYVTCGAGDMRAYRINAGAFRPGNYCNFFFLIYINTYIRLYMYILRIRTFRNHNFLPDVPACRASVVFFFFLSVFRIKFACSPVVNVALAARGPTLPPLPHRQPRCRAPPFDRAPFARVPPTRGIAFSILLPLLLN